MHLKRTKNSIHIIRLSSSVVKQSVCIRDILGSISAIGIFYLLQCIFIIKPWKMITRCNYEDSLHSLKQSQFRQKHCNVVITCKKITFWIIQNNTYKVHYIQGMYVYKHMYIHLDEYLQSKIKTATYKVCRVR